MTNELNSSYKLNSTYRLELIQRLNETKFITVYGDFSLHEISSLLSYLTCTNGDIHLNKGV